MITDMTGELEGFESEEPEHTLGDLNLVPVHVGEVDVEAIALHDMPSDFVLDLMITPVPFKIVKSIALFKLAMGVDGAEKTELATFAEMYAGMNQWVDDSNKAKDDPNAESEMI